MSNVIDYAWDFTKEDFSLDLDFFNEKDQEDKMWQARTGLNYDTLCGAVETIIFMSDRPINLLKIKNQIDNDLPLRVVHEAISRLQEEYESKHHGIRLMEVAEGYQFRTKATYSKLIQDMFKVSTQQLSPSALEVLAMIAYKQPVSKSSIESIRGVDSSHIIRQLMDKRLVKISGRSEELGRPSLYTTTHEFLEIFNLANLDSLPTESELMELASASEVASINEIKTIVQKGDKKKFDLDELEELDSLTESIKQISSDTLFTRSLKDVDKQKHDDDTPRKSAFDLLEDYVSAAESLEQNKEAIKSEPPMSFMNPRLIDISLDQLFNTPSDEDDISMELRELPKPIEDEDIQLDDSALLDLENSLDQANIEFEKVLSSVEQTQEQVSEIPSEADKLSMELDQAFENLMGEPLDTEDLTEDDHQEGKDFTHVFNDLNDEDGNIINRD